MFFLFGGVFGRQNPKTHAALDISSLSLRGRCRNHVFCEW